MVRSLYSGISGLRNHQVSMDVTGNNIANVNTIGFKAGRVTFEESMYQLLQGATRPAGNSGGTNPLQVGLGMSIGSIDTILTQGNLQTTGQITDLALEGKLILLSPVVMEHTTAEMVVFSRCCWETGLPTNGFTLQGMMAASDGTFPPGSKIEIYVSPMVKKHPRGRPVRLHIPATWIRILKDWGLLPIQIVSLQGLRTPRHLLLFLIPVVMIWV